MGWMEELIQGRNEEKRLQYIRSQITATGYEAIQFTDVDTKIRLESLRRQHHELTGCGGPS